MMLIPPFFLLSPPYFSPFLLLSISLKKRWEDPEFRTKYSDATRGNRSHSNETRARIAAAITMKWQNEEYRAKISSPPSEEVKAR
jgi:hypothetical protein